MQGTQEIVVKKRAYAGRAIEEVEASKKLEVRVNHAFQYSPPLVMFTIDTADFMYPKAVAE